MLVSSDAFRFPDFACALERTLFWNEKAYTGVSRFLRAMAAANDTELLSPLNGE
jgi:hypothetical protein